MKDNEKAFFHKYLDTIELEDSDYFNHGRDGYKCKKTILNSQEKCLKRCEELLK
jgi:hypothetical protein